MSWMCVLKLRGRYGALAAEGPEGWALRGFETEEQGLEYFEAVWNQAHARGHESSMSACLNWLTFNPSIVDADLAEIEPLVEKLTVVRSANVAGWAYYVPLRAEASALWERGRKPSLIRHVDHV